MITDVSSKELRKLSSQQIASMTMFGSAVLAGNSPACKYGLNAFLPPVILVPPDFL